MVSIKFIAETMPENQNFLRRSIIGQYSVSNSLIRNKLPRGFKDFRNVLEQCWNCLVRSAKTAPVPSVHLERY